MVAIAVVGPEPGTLGPRRTFLFAITSARRVSKLAPCPVSLPIWFSIRIPPFFRRWRLPSTSKRTFSSLPCVRGVLILGRLRFFLRTWPPFFFFFFWSLIRFFVLFRRKCLAASLPTIYHWIRQLSRLYAIRCQASPFLSRHTFTRAIAASWDFPTPRIFSSLENLVNVCIDNQVAVLQSFMFWSPRMHVSGAKFCRRLSEVSGSSYRGGSFGCFFSFFLICGTVLGRPTVKNLKICIRQLIQKGILRWVATFFSFWIAQVRVITDRLHFSFCVSVQRFYFLYRSQTKKVKANPCKLGEFLGDPRVTETLVPIENFPSIMFLGTPENWGFSFTFYFQWQW